MTPISKMTLGTVQLGLEYGIANKTGKPSAEKAFEILDIAAAGGVNTFDTANIYGDSEELLGACGEIERQIRTQAELSLARLNIRRIPIYMIHIPGDRTQRIDPCVPGILRRMQAEGLIEKAGVSVYRPHEADEMLQYDVFEAIQIPMNIFDLRMVRSGALKRLSDAGRTVFVRSVFLQGLFFLTEDQLPDAFRAAAPSLRKLREIAEKTGVSIAQLALAFIRDMEGVTSLVLGSETPEQTAQNISLIKCPHLSGEANGLLEELSAGAPIEAIMEAITGRK
jgi:aryl-alcohol dehydrogenase-like predicted oxidoreductase